MHRKKLTSKVQEMEEALQAAELKAQGLEKVKARMNQDLEDFMLDLEKVQNLREIAIKSFKYKLTAIANQIITTEH